LQANFTDKKKIIIIIIIMFVPVSVETMGSWNVDSINFVSTIGKKLIELSGDPLETSYLFQRLSVAIQRGNEVSIAGTLSNFGC